MAQIRILEVTSIQFHKDEKSGQVLIAVTGTAATPGYTNVELRPLEKKLSADGIYDMELVGTPPDGIVIQVLDPVTASLVFKDGDALVGARVVARTNEMTALVSGGGARAGGAAAAMSVSGSISGGAQFAGAIPEAAMEAQFLTTQPRLEEFKTLLQGEEGPKTFFRAEEVKTLLQGEEDPKTFALGEEGPKTFAFGEEDPKTLAKWEEAPKTLAFGEEGPKTTAFGEEGPKTAAIGEEGPTTERLGEEGKPSFGETDPRTDDPTGPVGEDFNTDLLNQGRRNPFTRR